MSEDNSTITRHEVQNQLTNLLNQLVENKDGIDAVFVVELGNNFLLGASSTKEGRVPELVDKLGGKGGAGAGGKGVTYMSVLQSLKRQMDKFGEEAEISDLQYAILQFGKGTVFAYIYHSKNTPLAICFVNKKHEGDALGNMVYFCEENIEEVRTLVKQAFNR
ncbi:MAG: hypothetical protein DRR19_33480 [Candidatus Parabeggiatoa sp. nov. 1]|nr:MAG: hypothetical protein DRR19_33480 [Gammaproteobacteria bacterium]